VAVTVSGLVIVIVSEELAELEAPDQFVKTKFVPVPPATWVGLMEKDAEVPAVYHPEPAAFP
jgi:hypothetical protein